MPAGGTHWSWDHFYTDGQHFGQNRSNKNAWCSGCLYHHCEMLRQSDIASIAATGMGVARTAEERHDIGELLINICIEIL